MRRLSVYGEYLAYAAITFGLWLAWEPLGFVGGGILLLQEVLTMGAKRESDQDSS